MWSTLGYESIQASSDRCHTQSETKPNEKRKETKKERRDEREKVLVILSITGLLRSCKDHNDGWEAHKVVMPSAFE